MQPRAGGKEEEEHVLVLDFLDNTRGKKSKNTGFMLAPPPALTPAAVKKLIEKRNERFAQSVDELLLATPEDEDPVLLLQAAAHDHIPVNPSSGKKAPEAFGDTKGKGKQVVPDWKDRPSINEIIDEILNEGWYKDQIVDRRTFEAREGQIGVLDPPLSESIRQALHSARNITELYTHQVAAIGALSQGKDVIVSTSTASGKSVIYQVPILRFLEDDPASTALLIYPTKALAQDQKAALQRLLSAHPSLSHIRIATYDGDTPQDSRREIRDTASVIFTNFDMLHASLLPHEDLWRRFLKNLKLVAVDELHYYHQLFGSHVAMVVRRFRRVCAAVGNRRVRFVSCSATIASPGEHMRRVFGLEDVEEVTEDGAPSGRKDFLIWNPPPVDPMDPSLGRHSSLSEATGLMRFLMKRGVRVILFCKIRKTCELAMKTLRADLSSEGRLDILNKVMSYRGGYSQEDRRKIERDAFSGHLLGIVATNALELGVDIGVLDAVIMLGFPISIASFRQQAGRAGRRARDALTVLVADSLPIDQHYVLHPDELFEKGVKDLVLDLESKPIVEAHLQCAAHEMPLRLEDEKWFGPLTKELCETKLSEDKDGWYHVHPKYLPFPAKHVSLRGVEEEKYTVVDISHFSSSGSVGRIVEEVEVSRALFELYEGGIFIHQGLTFMVQEISHDSKVAKVVRADVNWITEPRDFTNVDAVQTYRIREIRGSSHRAFFGPACIRNKTILDAVDLDTPPWQRETTGAWIDVPKSALELMQDRSINAAAAIHSAQHAYLNQFALGADLRTECKVPEKGYKASESQRKRPARLIFYDIHGKGGAVAAKAFDHVSDVLRSAVERVESCPCEEGCAACVNSPSCKEGNVVSSKLGALLILKTILEMPIDPNAFQDQYESPDEAHQTIVQASFVRPVEGVEVEAD
ncbi:P-loop containing nucleoside triphosphate hydrolase protein [Gloeophyllum trabeum ATCC 11539]|uniref:p-loop containing nucleoside triphosphate hydrolase protein n=1 Tax=Gloeophyllum trabeum (strain ATCC 11539 / FP-39264 / Madison 617) TaxID=670483 RepID=S7RXH4_GLOTA|nr:P-loop containing nucleoside triphosphate hydrolase protein [Gloeophyllum trabeum ATCC 11539]EPQ58049.1 P-loop containing nucleoside triphosphate hydrolase protein [Gloeophyllum trabeum ATCC 11539]